MGPAAACPRRWAPGRQRSFRVRVLFLKAHHRYSVRSRAAAFPLRRRTMRYALWILCLSLAGVAAAGVGAQQPDGPDQFLYADHWAYDALSACNQLGFYAEMPIRNCAGGKSPYTRREFASAI